MADSYLSLRGQTRPLDHKTINCNVAIPYRWRTHEGQLIAPANMTNSHLFNSVRMIYNWYVEYKGRSDMRVYGGHWGCTLNAQQLKDATENLIPELAKRKLTHQQQGQLTHMLRCLAKLDTTLKLQ